MSFADYAGFLSEAVVIMDYVDGVLSSRSQYGPEEFYLDVAAAIQEAVESGVPFFAGKNADVWSAAADALSIRSESYTNRTDLQVALELEPVPDDFVASYRVITSDLEKLLKVSDRVISVISAEHWDSDVTDAGKGLTLAECLKVVALFVRILQNLYFNRGSLHNASPHMVWSQVVYEDLFAAYTAMGEGSQLGDLGDPNAAPAGDQVPWSMPK